MKRFLTSRLALIAVALLAVQSLAACSTAVTPAPSPSATPAPTTPAKPAAPQEIRIGIPSDGDTLDPASFTNVYSYSVAVNIYSALVRYKPGTIDLEPDLAKSWSIEEGGKKWVFQLRDNVTWQGNYGKLTSQDVVYSFNRILDPATASRFRTELSDVDRVEAQGDYTVVFHLKAANAGFLHSVAAFRQGFITKKEAVEKFGKDYPRNPVGTGPYILEKWTANNELVLKSNDNYFLGKPPISKATFVVIPDENVRMLALQKGELDIAMNLSNPEIRKQLLAIPKMKLGEIASTGMQGYRLTWRSNPLTT